MEINIHYQLAYYTTNVNVMGMHWKTFGTAFWYDARLEDYHHACMRAVDIVWNEIYEQFPHLKGTTFDYTESGDIPVIEVEKTSIITKEAINSIELVQRNDEPNMYGREFEPTLEEQIKSCTSPAVLKAVYEKITKGKPEEKIYKAKLKELSK